MGDEHDQPNQHDRSATEMPGASTLADAGGLDDTEIDAVSRALTPGQRRAIGAFLHQVAHAIKRFESLTGEQLGERLAYVEVVNDLTAAERVAARQFAEALVREANMLAAQLRIPSETTSVRASLAAEFSVLWATAEDTAPKRLVGYGPVAPEVARLLAPAIARMARLSFTLAQLKALAGGDDALSPASSSPSSPLPVPRDP